MKRTYLGAIHHPYLLINSHLFKKQKQKQEFASISLQYTVPDT